MPESHIGAVCCLFNPFQLESRVRNYAVFARGIEKVGIRLLTVELSFNETPFVTDAGPDAIHLPSGDVMWQKERLLQIGGERLVSEGYAGIVFLDADVVFRDDNWPVHVAEALARCPAVQCFSEAVMNYRDTVVRTESAVKAWYDDRRLSVSAKGFAWAMRSELFARTGLYQHCVVGGGDSALSLAALGRAHGSNAWEETLKYQPFMRPVGPTMVAHYQVWADRFHRSTGGAVGFAEGTIENLPHGSLKRRQYTDRHHILAGFDPTREVSALEGGAFLWTPLGEPRQRPVLRYMLDREMDTD